ncbi:hypothetical protein B0H67DRAFT_591110 [Lasiosphaeris hirsuta]|uniref:Uncharacterized protein n=1 Tax=Lasiosphaeris hirsuta TaxID=260670 RepID=A0AA39ZV64_9PEZI|nr:hypothetical protein B0H67DRAFT_591110 [Lasiosphaeris hirsuta]
MGYLSPRGPPRSSKTRAHRLTLCAWEAGQCGRAKTTRNVQCAECSLPAGYLPASQSSRRFAGGRLWWSGTLLLIEGRLRDILCRWAAQGLWPQMNQMAFLECAASAISGAAIPVLSAEAKSNMSPICPYMSLGLCSCTCIWFKVLCVLRMGRHPCCAVCLPVAPVCRSAVTPSADSIGPDPAEGGRDSASRASEAAAAAAAAAKYRCPYDGIMDRWGS